MPPVGTSNVAALALSETLAVAQPRNGRKIWGRQKQPRASERMCFWTQICRTSSPSARALLGCVHIAEWCETREPFDKRARRRSAGPLPRLSSSTSLAAVIVVETVSKEIGSDLGASLDPDYVVLLPSDSYDHRRRPQRATLCRSCRSCLRARGSFTDLKRSASFGSPLLRLQAPRWSSLPSSGGRFIERRSFTRWSAQRFSRSSNVIR